MLVFVPLTAKELAGWAGSGRFVPTPAFAVTASLRQAFGFTPDDDEDAGHTALHIAGLAGLLQHRTRLVVVAETSARAVSAHEFGEFGEFGEVDVGELPWGAVTALFGDEASVASDELRRRLQGLSLATAWDEPDVADFLAEHELSWHGPEEWPVLAG